MNDLKVYKWFENFKKNNYVRVIFEKKNNVSTIF